MTQKSLYCKNEMTHAKIFARHTIGHVIAAHELDRIRQDFLVDLFDADLASAHVATRQTEIIHALQHLREDSGGDE